MDESASRNFHEEFPHPDEDNLAYALRLQSVGHDEMFIRKALRVHFSMGVSEFAQFFDQLEPARLRYVALIIRIDPHRTEYSLARKVSRNLSISMEKAEHLIKKHMSTQQV